mmetsp:Transcript_41665/g.97705  ORF Transcript_41665/g.97705 Transcript_41665/m.97705 type:complete len:295 (-) Transcript_41665:848-1732(-)
MTGCLLLSKELLMLSDSSGRETVLALLLRADRGPFSFSLRLLPDPPEITLTLEVESIDIASGLRGDVESSLMPLRATTPSIGHVLARRMLAIWVATFLPMTPSLRDSICCGDTVGGTSARFPLTMVSLGEAPAGARSCGASVAASSLPASTAGVVSVCGASFSVWPAGLDTFGQCSVTVGSVETASGASSSLGPLSTTIGWNLARAASGARSVDGLGFGLPGLPGLEGSMPCKVLAACAAGDGFGGESGSAFWGASTGSGVAAGGWPHRLKLTLGLVLFLAASLISSSGCRSSL